MAGDHDFYVAAAASTVLVHNCPASDGTGAKVHSSEARSEADRLGYKPTGSFSHGQQLFRNGTKYISQDTDIHSGGTWKMADSIKTLGRKAIRTGTFDGDLNWIAP